MSRSRIARWVMPGLTPVWCRKKSSKSSASPGLEDRAHDARIGGDTFDELRPDRPVELSTMRARLDDVVQSPRHDVEAGRVVAAV